MNFKTTTLDGAFLVSAKPYEDDRGWFSRNFCEREFGAQGLARNIVQCSTAFVSEKGTLKGMHFQKPPHQETKLVRCMQGEIFDVIVDMRPDSRTYLQHEAFLLSEADHQSLYIPTGFAHGFQTLTDNCLVDYKMDEFFVPELSTGVRYDDPSLMIQWPMPAIGVSEKDTQWPFL